jgi:hypothetical protein
MTHHVSFKKLVSNVLIVAEAAFLLSFGGGSVVLAQSENGSSLSVSQNTINQAPGDLPIIRQVRVLDLDPADLRNPAGIAFSNRANAFQVMEGRGSTAPGSTAFIKLTPFAHGVGTVRITAEVQNARNIVELSLAEPIAAQTSSFASSVVKTMVMSGGTPPTVDAGPDQQITIADVAFLHPTVSDDGLPEGLASMTWAWSQVAGPSGVTVDHPNELNTVARFPGTGVYTLRLTVSDGQLVSYDEMVVTVLSAHPHVIRVPLDYPTIQAAINAAQAHDLVLVSPGTYRENVTITKTLTLASTYYTTGDPAMVNQTIIRSPDPLLDAVRTSSSTGPETQFIGFTAMDGNDGIQVRGQAKVIGNRFLNALNGDGVEYGSGDSGYVFGNLMENNYDDGIDLIDSEVLVEGNIIRFNDGDGIETRVTNHSTTVAQLIFRGNDFIGSTQDGIQLIDNDTIAATAVQVIIDRNTIANNGQAALGLMDNAASSEDYRAASLLERVVLSNNTIVGNFYGISGGDNSVVVNNLITGTANTALKRVDGTSTVTYNLFWNNLLDNDGSNLDSTHTLYANPLLDAAYRPDGASPARDAGTAELVLPTGEQVLSIPPSAYVGTAPDLGRYEISGSSDNARPSVNAGSDQNITLPNSATLDGTVSDDGLPNPPATVTTTWSKVSGPGTVSFGNANAVDTTASFSAAGTYTLRLTANDSVLSTSDDITITVSSSSSDLIFADGFESGNLSAWSSSTIDGGDLSASPAAAIAGTSGLRAVIDDNNSIFVTDDRPNAEPRYRARFYFDPNSIPMASGDAHFILEGYAGTSTKVLRVAFRNSSGAYQVRAELLNDGTTWTNTSWFTITDAPHSIELDWRAATAVGANNGGLTLWIDNVQRANLTGVDNDNRRIDRARLGAVAGIDTGTRGTYYFDAFESRRQTFIGP